MQEAEKRPACAVIIPVYNAFADTRECLESVLKHSNEAQKILLIDDASPDGELRTALAGVATDRRVEIIRNPSNLGFVGTCNFGMQHCAGLDVVLLNSDTIVTRGWLKKLRECAYSRPDAATATPFTNNGTICSLPRFAVDNELPEGVSVDSFAELVEAQSLREYPELPTCVGFCVYIKRSALDKVGLFDAETFGRGYGEENDFSCRAQRAGFADLLDDATFVYHKGGTSFAGAKQALVDKNSAALSAKHPHYFDSVARFCREDPLRPARNRVLEELTLGANEKFPRRVLHIIHNGPCHSRGEPLGGTELHVRDLIMNVPGVSHWSLTPSKRAYFLSAHVPGAEREFVLDLQRTSLESILKRDFFDLIHLHHSRYIDHNELCRALVKHGNYVVSMHDFILVCPRFHLYTPFRKVCNGHECAESCGYSRAYIDEYRESTRQLLSHARKVVCFSNSTREHVEKIISVPAAWKQLAHGILNVNPRRGTEPEQAPAPGASSRPLRVCFLGYIPQHKGSLLIEKIIGHTALPDGTPLEWHVVGKLFLEAGDRVIQHGEYARENLQAMLQEVKPDLVAILSICPETYCLTLDEAWNAGIPVVVTPYGAPAERVQATGAGWVLPKLEVQAFMECLAGISADWLDYLARKAKIAKTAVFSVAEEGASYGRVYTECLSGQQSALELLLAYLRQFGLQRPPEPSLVMKLAGRALSAVIYCLDALQVRGHVQRAATALLPRRFLEELKASR